MKQQPFLQKAIPSLVASIMTALSAHAESHAVTIEGNGWVAIFVILFFVAVIYFIIIGSLQTEERDGRLGRYNGGHDHGWFGMSGRRGDDDGGNDPGDNSN